MKQDKINKMHYTADKGKYIVPKDKTNFFYTEDIWIGSVDSIENYEEVKATEIETEVDDGSRYNDTD